MSTTWRDTGLHCSHVLRLTALSQGARSLSLSALSVGARPPVGHTLARRPLGMLRESGGRVKSLWELVSGRCIPFLLDHAGVAAGLSPSGGSSRRRSHQLEWSGDAVEVNGRVIFVWLFKCSCVAIWQMLDCVVRKRPGIQPDFLNVVKVTMQ